MRSFHYFIYNKDSMEIVSHATKKWEVDRKYFQRKKKGERVAYKRIHAPRASDARKIMQSILDKKKASNP